jgi:hypothetical protein
MTAPRVVPAFGGYVARATGSGDADLFAWWTNGAIARLALDGTLIALADAPDYAALFPTPEPPPVVADAPEPSATAHWRGLEHWTCGGECGWTYPARISRCLHCGTERPPFATSDPF